MDHDDYLDPSSERTVCEDQLETVDDEDDPWRQWLRYTSDILLRNRLPFVEMVPDAASARDVAVPIWPTRKEPTIF